MLNCFNERIEIEKTTKISININDLYEKKLDKGSFYFIKLKGKEINTEDELIKIIPK